MFATLIVEKDPLKLEGLPAQVYSWLLVAGAVAVFGLFVRGLLRLIQANERGRPKAAMSVGTWLLASVVVGVLLGLLPTGMHKLWTARGWMDPNERFSTRNFLYHPLDPDTESLPAWMDLVPIAAGIAGAAVLLPMLLNFPRLRGRRVWALAKLSFKEALRKRVLWGFSFLLVLFLFASWFLPYKPENQVRNYVNTVYLAMTILLLVTAGLLAAFSIPADLRNQTIHTIVTKPVERFEILVGRLLGYTLLMTLVLVVMQALSLVYVARGVDQEAADESLKARVPVYGDLAVKNGKNVGSEWEYRQYISGAVADEEAVWSFRDLPSDLADRPETVRCEFTFDIFRTTKGEENKGVNCSFVFQNAQWDPKRIDEYRREREQVMSQPDPAVLARAQTERWPLDRRQAVLCNGLAEKYGYYELNSKEVVDFHTLFVDVPAGLFRRLRDAGAVRPGQPPLQVVVQCESRTQYLGMAKYDLYLLASERGAGADLAGFGMNFFKGGVGLWFQMFLVMAIAVTCSTYLSGVISFIVAMMFYILGLFPDFLKELAQGKTPGGGPMESLIRVSGALPQSAPLEQTATVSAAQVTDVAMQYGFKLFVRLIPDIDRLSLTNNVAEGFNISYGQLALTGLFLAGYLTPWLVLGYYLIKSREVAA